MTGGLDIQRFSGVTADSRNVVEGGLFVAVAGEQADGRDFIEDAIAKGAAAILTDMRPGLEAWDGKIEVLQDPTPRRRLSELAAAYFGVRPSTVALVTGSSGKTSTVEFIRQIWTKLDKPAASVGTLGVVTPASAHYGGLTSPDPVALMATLAELAAADIVAAAIEASSHGLDQSRLDGVQAEIGVFTSFSRDHLDYHHTETAYLAAKLRLFSDAMAPGGFALVSARMAEAPAVLKAARAAGQIALSYGPGGGFLNLKRATPDGFGLILDIVADGTPHRIRLDHFAGFQAENALAAAGAAIVSGADPKDALGAIETLEQPAGRMQRVAATPSGAPIYVDYAHKPGALEAALRALKAVTHGQITVVFGCGGDRDKGKRPMMGEIAHRLANRVIVTDDNPRTEAPGPIRKEILDAAPSAEDVPDRAEAIRQAMQDLQAGDAVLIAGKGHEQGQIVGDQILPFDDATEARAAVAALEIGEAAS